jgi:hypothetical protein
MASTAEQSTKDNVMHSAKMFLDVARPILGDDNFAFIGDVALRIYGGVYCEPSRLYGHPREHPLFNAELWEWIGLDINEGTGRNHWGWIGNEGGTRKDGDVS